MLCMSYINKKKKVVGLKLKHNILKCQEEKKDKNPNMTQPTMYEIDNRKHMGE